MGSLAPALKTKSAAVEHSLREKIKLWKIRGLSEFVGAGIWEKDLSKMRED